MDLGFSPLPPPDLRKKPCHKVNQRTENHNFDLSNGLRNGIYINGMNEGFLERSFKNAI